MIVYYGLLLFFVLEYARPGTFIPGINALRLNLLVPIGVITGTMLQAGPVSNADVLKETNSKLMLGLLSLIVVSFVVADVTMMAFELLTTVTGYVLVYWVVTRQAYTLPRLKGVFAVLIAVHLLLAAMTPQMFTDPSTRHYIAGGTFLGDGNDFALSLNVVIPFCLFLLYEAKKRVHKGLVLLVLLLLCLCIVATQSRGGTIALGFVAFYYWLSSKRKMMTAAVTLVVVIVILIFAPPAYFQRMNTISNYESDGSAQGRITAWKAATGMALSNPLIGVGAGNFPVNFTKFAPPGPEGPETRWKTAHSIYFLILGELGFSGLLLLIAFIAVNVRDNRRLLKTIRAPGRGETTESRLLAALTASVLAYAIAGTFLSATYYPHMFVLAGLCVASRRIVRERSSVSTVQPAGAAIRLHPAARRAMGSRCAS